MNAARRHTSPMLNDSAAVWLFLKQQAGLNIKTYDADLERELRSRLSLPPDGLLETHLRSKDIDVERFLAVFFQAVQPYAEMMSDLLAMFEKAGIRETNQNAAIRFNFSKSMPELSFELSHFRQWREKWFEIAGRFMVNQWTLDTLWQLHRALWVRDKEVADPTARLWVLDYFEGGIWPPFDLAPPQSGYHPLDEILRRVWRLWRTVVTESEKYGPLRREAREHMGAQHREPERGDDEGTVKEPWPPELLAKLDVEDWAGSVAASAYRRVEMLTDLSTDERTVAARQLAEAIEAVFDSVPKSQMTGRALVQAIEEFLQIPIWIHRHELYSVWVGSCLLNALDDMGVQIHHVKGSLLLSFKGTHLATLTELEPVLYLWAELRSPLGNPVGKKRKRHIQPDYSLVGSPITAAETSVLEVECKHYRVPNAGEFRAALTDYANGRPKAHVVLVNYGPAGQSILDGVDPSVRDRTHIIGEMRPGSTAARATFDEIVKERVSKLRRRTAPPVGVAAPATLSGEAEVTLSWKDFPRDLDLHLCVSSSGRSSEVCYSNLGDEAQEPCARLSGDVRSGNGPETLYIAKWIDKAQYHIAVHRYTDDGALSTSGASVTFAHGSLCWTFDCPREGDGDWWDVLVVDKNTGSVQVINKIVQSRPW